MVLVGFIFNLETPDTEGGVAPGKDTGHKEGPELRKIVPEVWTEPDQERETRKRE